MTGLNYPDNLYADHEERKARRSQQPTGAYRSAATADDDPYTVRARWLDALATLPPATARMLPPLTTLAQQTLAADDRGKRLRAWLAGPHTTAWGTRRKAGEAGEAGEAADTLVRLLRDQASC